MTLDGSEYIPSVVGGGGDVDDNADLVAAIFFFCHPQQSLGKLFIRYNSFSRVEEGRIVGQECRFMTPHPVGRESCFAFTYPSAARGEEGVNLLLV